MCGSPVSHSGGEPQPSSRFEQQPQIPSQDHSQTPPPPLYVPPQATPGGSPEKREIDIFDSVERGVKIYLSSFYAIFFTFLIASILAKLISEGAGFGILRFLPEAGVPEELARLLSQAFSGFLIGLLNSIVGGLIVHKAAESYLGTKFSQGSLAVANKRKWNLLVGSFVYGFAIALGLIAFILPGLLAMTALALWQPAVILEENSGAGLNRSLELTKKNLWEIFLIIIIIAIIQWLVSSIVSNAIFFVLASAHISIPAFLVSGLAEAIPAPLTAVTATVVYYRVQGR